MHTFITIVFIVVAPLLLVGDMLKYKSIARVLSVLQLSPVFNLTGAPIKVEWRQVTAAPVTVPYYISSPDIINR